MQNLKIHITGNIYRVGFRYFIKQMAERFGVFGLVQYSKDKSILIEASGKEYSLDQFLIFCRLGCQGSKVEKISISENQIQYNNSFEIEFEDYEKNQTPTSEKE